MRVYADLHLHSCVSPCVDLSLSPKHIVETLCHRNIRLAALTDFNTSLNCPAFALQCQRHGIAPLFGMEAQTAEAVRVLVLFADLELAVAFSDAWYAHLPETSADIRTDGDQYYVDENGTILGVVEKPLLASTDVMLSELADKVHKLGGLVIPSNADAPEYSLLSQFGHIVDGGWDAIELRGLEARDISCSCPVITSSGALYDEEIGSRRLELDIGIHPLVCADGTVNLAAVRAAFARLVAVKEAR